MAMKASLTVTDDDEKDSCFTSSTTLRWKGKKIKKSFQFLRKFFWMLLPLLLVILIATAGSHNTALYGH
jgi:hypothetical protein